ncbi:hypothetical protein DVR12_07850 [Chitinophaga silvatica]|uniref:DUF6249 domain-containing protein n=1 Tax=Chitinophaga silvatica TaxID=2282649 RepID=A0A3E1YEY8_9BACT|nr:DUF6249 domain-containing protein [Chitinophaga silvatica]RFS25088.1 hypothetical protein DVR12_07850 [Chitinophaga silvatica]
MQITSAAVVIALALTIYSFCYYYFTTRHKERLMVLEKGLPADFFSKHISYLPALLVLGIVFIGIALGAITGLVLENLLPGLNPVVLLVATVFVFTGVSLIIAFFILKRLIGKNYV